MSIEELANLEVTSVSKRSEPRLAAAAAVFVITGEQIRRSGATSIPEAHPTDRRRAASPGAIPSPSARSDDPREVERCYALGCNVYMTKPVEPLAFIEAVNRLGLFLSVINVPPEQGAPR